MLTLFPAIKPYRCHELKVDEPHVLYVEETGNPQGIPVIVLHPGPGGGGDTHLRRYFDPEHYRIILFDQRGCGRSTPHCETRNNSTQLLLEDIETIRDYLGLQRFVLSGGGWGSLLALLYAQQYPQYIKALLLYQIFLGRNQDVDWFYKHGASKIYPDHWQDFISIASDDEQQSILYYYAQCLKGHNELARMAAAKNWALWQAHCSSVQPHLNIIDQYSDTHFALALATLESYYIQHQYFIEDNQVLANARKIRHIPSYLIHGRYDMVCPLDGAWLLNNALPASDLYIVRDAGHSEREPGMIDAIILASNAILRQDLTAC